MTKICSHSFLYPVNHENVSCPNSSGMRISLFLQHWVTQGISILERSLTLLLISTFSRNLLSLCMTNTATLQRLMRQDCTCLLGSKDPMTPFLQLVHLSFNMLDDLHSKLLAFEVNQQNVQCNLKVLACGAGKKKKWWSLGCFSVNHPTHRSVLPAADKMSLHGWMLGTMQMLSLDPEVLSTV